MSAELGLAPAAIVQAAPWARLWRTGVLHSCATGIRGNYDQEIRDFWQAQIAGLISGQTMVDIGTGNGAIALLARQHAVERGIDLRIHGVDLADIDPPRHVAGGAALYGGIHFHPRTSMTRMPFADGEVSLLCSQFAFEYAAHDEAAAEILRVIGHRGRAAFVVHSVDSVIATVGDAQLDACRWLLNDSGVLQATGALASAMAGATTPTRRAALARDAIAEAARHAFNDRASMLLSRIEARPTATVLQQTAQRIAQLLAQPSTSPDEAEDHVTRLRAWIEDEQRRLAQMQAAALDRPALDLVAILLRASGLPVRTDRMHYGGSVCMGWTVVVGHD